MLFQHLDTLYTKGIVKLFGRTLDGKSIVVSNNYVPPIIVNTPLPRLRERIAGYLASRVYGEEDSYKTPSVSYYLKLLRESGHVRCQTLRGQNLCAYDEESEHTFYKYTFEQRKQYYAARSLVGTTPVFVAERADDTMCVRAFAYAAEAFNTQVNPGMQYMIEHDLMSSGVFEIDAKHVVTRNGQLMGMGAVRAADTHEQAPVRILSYDLECFIRTGAHGKLIFPDAAKDPIITIGVVHTHGKAVWCLQPTDDIDGIQVYSFLTEKAMLRSFNRFVQEYDPDFIIGHNVNRFDNVYYEKRCVQHGLTMDWSRVPGYACHVRKIVTQSNQKGTREVFRLDIPGRVVLDTYEKFREDHNLRSYKLNELGKHFLKQEKYDMPYAQIPIKYRSKEGRTEIADYCVQDSNLVYELVKTQCKILNTIGLANVTGVTAKDILQRGQGIRTISLMIRYCNRNVPRLFVPTGEHSEHAFEGAVVLPPLRGKYDDAVVCVDFASLYPSIMQAMNMCYSTLVTRPTIEHMDWAEDEQVRTVPDYEMGDRLKILFNPNNVSFVTTDVREGILPKILNDVLNERRAVKKEMKQHFGTPHYGVLNGRQLALKVTANSVYGFTGAQKGFLPEPRIASSVTKYGRGLTLRTMDMVDNNPAWKGSKVIYGDSVTHDTPLLLRVRGKLLTSTIEDVAARDGATWEPYGNKERAALTDVEVWSDDKDTFRWTKVFYVVRHQTRKQLYRVTLPCGMVDVTSDHSLLTPQGEEIKPGDVKSGVELMVSAFPEEPESYLDWTYERGYDIGASILGGGDGVYAVEPQSRVPEEVLCAPLTVVQGFLEGLLRTFRKTTYRGTKELLLGIAYCAQRAGWYFSPHSEPSSCKNELFRFDLRPVIRVLRTAVQTVCKIPSKGKPVYDLTTETHHFAVGPGRLVVHNTDSCFIHLSRAICDGKDSQELVARAHVVGEEMAKEITQQFLHPVLMEYENAFEPPFYLLKKKRYLGKRVLPGRSASVYIKGCECIRRDFAPLVVEIQRQMIDLLLDNNVDDAIHLVQQTYTDLYKGKIPLEKLIMSKKLSQLPEHYKTKAPHVELAKRLQRQRPEKAPVAGDRVEYVIRRGREKLYERAIAPDEVDQHSIDYEYYAEKQLKKPLARIMELVCDANQLFPRVPLTAAVNKAQLKRLGITASERPKRRKLMQADAAACAKMADRDIRNYFKID